MAVKHLTSSDFNDTINSGSVVLVDFWASWCGPCRMVAPIIDTIGAEMAGKAVVAKVNVDEEEEIARTYGIMSIPSLFVFKNGKVADKMVGVPQNAKSAITDMIKRNL